MGCPEVYRVSLCQWFHNFKKGCSPLTVCSCNGLPCDYGLHFTCVWSSEHLEGIVLRHGSQLFQFAQDVHAQGHSTLRRSPDLWTWGTPIVSSDSPSAFRTTHSWRMYNSLWLNCGDLWCFPIRASKIIALILTKDQLALFTIRVSTGGQKQREKRNQMY